MTTYRFCILFVNVLQWGRCPSPFPAPEAVPYTVQAPSFEEAYAQAWHESESVRPAGIHTFSGMLSGSAATVTVHIWQPISVMHIP